VPWLRRNNIFLTWYQSFTVERTKREITCLTHQIIPIFNGKAYSFWKIKMKTILKTRKLWDIIENRVTVSSSSENTPALTRERDDQVMKDMMAMQILKQQFPMLFFQGLLPQQVQRMRGMRERWSFKGVLKWKWLIFNLLEKSMRIWRWVKVAASILLLRS